MTIAIKGGSGDTEAKADTVSPCTLSPARMVTMVTPDGKQRSAARYSSEVTGTKSLYFRAPAGRRLELAQQTVLGQELGEEVGVSAGPVEQIERDARAPEVGEKARDLVVAVGPVGLHRDHLMALEGGSDLRRLEDQTLVHLAGEAPVGGDVHEDQAALARQALGLGAAPGDPSDELLRRRRFRHPRRGTGAGRDPQSERRGGEHGERCREARSRAREVAVAHPGEERQEEQPELKQGQPLRAHLAGEDVEQPDC